VRIFCHSQGCNITAHALELLCECAPPPKCIKIVMINPYAPGGLEQALKKCNEREGVKVNVLTLMGVNDPTLSEGYPNPNKLEGRPRLPPMPEGGWPDESDRPPEEERPFRTYWAPAGHSVVSFGLDEHKKQFSYEVSFKEEVRLTGDKEEIPRKREAGDRDLRQAIIDFLSGPCK